MEIQEIFTIYGIALFVLSQISERICNMLKLYLPEWLMGNLRNAEVNPVLEKKRERKLLLLSWIGGIITSILFWGVIVQADEASPLYFAKSMKNKFWFFTGMSIFLSFGSKFWHDILDILFLYKNAKRILNDSETYQLENTEDINVKLQTNRNDIVRKAWQSQKESFQKFPGVVAVSVGYPYKGEPVIRLYVESESVIPTLPKETIWVDERGFAHRIIIQVIVSGPIVAHISDQDFGGGVFNASTPNIKGTLGYFFKDIETEDRYILSCYHVMRANHPWNFFRPFNNSDEIHFGKNGVGVAQLVAGYRNNDLDVAIARIAQNDIEASPANTPLFKETSYVDESWINAPVQIKGAISELVKARVYESKVESTIVKYSDASTYDFKDFFSLILDTDSDNLIAPTQAGDSGALVYDPESKKALGIIVGGSNRLSYAMKISVIEQKLGIKLTNLQS